MCGVELSSVDPVNVPDCKTQCRFTVCTVEIVDSCHIDNISISSVAVTAYVMGKCMTFAMRLGPAFLLEVLPVQLHFSEFSSAHSFCVCFVG